MPWTCSSRQPAKYVSGGKGVGGGGSCAFGVARRGAALWRNGQLTQPPVIERVVVRVRWSGGSVQLTYAVEEKEQRSGGSLALTDEFKRKVAKYVVSHISKNLDVLKRSKAAPSSSSKSSKAKPSRHATSSSSSLPRKTSSSDKAGSRPHGASSGSSGASKDHQHRRSRPAASGAGAATKPEAPS